MLKSFKATIGSQDIREIVTILNKEPFDENFTLVSFDDMSAKDLKALLERVLMKLDSNVSVKLSEDSEENQAKVSDLLEILNYPSSSPAELAARVYAGDKSHIHPVIYYITHNFALLQKRAYLGYFLAPIQIPGEFISDPEMKAIYAEYKSLLGQFSAEHEAMEALVQKTPDIGRLAGDVAQLEKEKDALRVKLKGFEDKAPPTREFQDLLATTAALREAQEEDAKLTENLISQREGLTKAEEELLLLQQRLCDAEKECGADISGQDMLARLQKEAQRLAELSQGLELECTEKNAEVQENGRRLAEPIPSAEAQAKSEARVAALKAAVADLEARLAASYDAEKEEKLSIFRQQVEIVKAKKRELAEEAQSLTDERGKQDEAYESRRKELKRDAAPPLGDELSRVQASLNAQLLVQRRQQAEMLDLNAELDVLRKTARGVVEEFPLAADACDADEDPAADLKEASEERLAAMSAQLLASVEAARAKIKPLVEEHRKLKAAIKELEDEQLDLKNNFDVVVGGAAKENKDAGLDFARTRDEFNQRLSSVELYTEKGDVLELVGNMLKSEDAGGSIREDIKREVAENERLIETLKLQRERAKAAGLHAAAQAKTLAELESLLTAKLALMKSARKK